MVQGILGLARARADELMRSWGPARPHDAKTVAPPFLGCTDAAAVEIGSVARAAGGIPAALPSVSVPSGSLSWAARVAQAGPVPATGQGDGHMGRTLTGRAPVAALAQTPRASNLKAASGSRDGAGWTQTALGMQSFEWIVLTSCHTSAEPRSVRKGIRALVASSSPRRQVEGKLPVEVLSLPGAPSPSFLVLVPVGYAEVLVDMLPRVRAVHVNTIPFWNGTTRTAALMQRLGVDVARWGQSLSEKARTALVRDAHTHTDRVGALDARSFKSKQAVLGLLHRLRKTLERTTPGPPAAKVRATTSGSAARPAELVPETHVPLQPGASVAEPPPVSPGTASTMTDREACGLPVDMGDNESPAATTSGHSDEESSTSSVAFCSDSSMPLCPDSPPGPASQFVAGPCAVVRTPERSPAAKHGAPEKSSPEHNPKRPSGALRDGTPRASRALFVQPAAGTDSQQQTPPGPDGQVGPDVDAPQAALAAEAPPHPDARLVADYSGTAPAGSLASLPGAAHSDAPDAFVGDPTRTDQALRCPAADCAAGTSSHTVHATTEALVAHMNDAHAAAGAFLDRARLAQAGIGAYPCGRVFKLGTSSKALSMHRSRCEGVSAGCPRVDDAIWGAFIQATAPARTSQSPSSAQPSGAHEYHDE
ncbi:hypothetical protein FVE85_4583 [Porphyridium purpureum]|nr:hypothetical protein FVE85_4583 [Porphyridium purpureum]|eukprot:POR2584..scf252_32